MDGFDQLHSAIGERKVWIFVFAMLVGGVAAFFKAGFVMSATTGLAIGGTVATASVLCVAMTFFSLQFRVMPLVHAYLQQAMAGLGIMFLEYAAAMSGRPLIDAAILDIDRAIGFDWHAYLVFLRAHPTLLRVLTCAYDSLGMQLFLVLVMLWLTRAPRALDRFVVANATILLLTTAVFALCPVTTAWTHLAISGDELRALGLIPHGGWVRQLLDLRAGAVAEVTTDSNFAIIGFPSYHTAAALLIVATMWSDRAWRIPVTAWNALMIAATPYLGGHYLLDLVAAVPVVALATIVAGRVVPRRGDERGGAWPWVAAALRRGAPARPRRGPAMPAA